MIYRAITVVALAIAPSALAADPAPAPSTAPAAKATIPAPHPVISEVLFNVPKGEAGDSNKDGKRSTAGDEFIELFNPHPQTINLKGYKLYSRLAWTDKSGNKGVRFVFPDVSIAPGGVVVIFNGNDSTIPGPVGTAARAPSGPNSGFNNAAVFTIANKSRMSSFNNAGDFIVLASPGGDPIDVVSWGEPDERPPAVALRLESVRATVKGSVQRLAAEEPMQESTSIDGELFSPGKMPNPAAPSALAPSSKSPPPTEKPAPVQPKQTPKKKP